MKLTKQTRIVHIFGLLLIFLTVSCGSPQQTEPATNQIIPIPMPTPTGQAVEYGASLEEWEEASDSDAAQTESSESTVDEVVTEPSQDSAADASTNVAENESAAAAGETDTAVASSSIGSPFTFSNVIYQEIMWDALVPPDFTSEAIMAKYADQLAEIQDGSPEANELYMQMQAEFDNAPINDTLSGTLIRIPGFIAPLDYSDELITEFLLVPYFGACIHVPPPPANQTVLVTTSDEYGIKPEDSYNPVWIMGALTAEGATTNLAQAGYTIQDAIVEPYDWP